MSRLHLSIAVVALASVSLSGAEAPYRAVKEIPIGGTGGWDYISVDPAAHRLYVSHSSKVVVVDLDTDKVVGEVPASGVHGFAVAADLGKGYISNGAADKASIVDLKTLAVVGSVATGGNPDSILYVGEAKEVYTFNGRGHSATVFDAASGEVRATIDLGAKPEEAVSDPTSHRLFVNLEDTSSLAAIDTRTHTVIGKWPLAGCEEPTGIAFAAAAHRVFSTCGNKVLTMTDSESGKVVQTIPIGTRVDGAGFDPGTGHVFASNGEGTVTIAHLDTPDTLRVVQTLTTEPSARTMTVDPTTHRIYLPAAKMQPAAPGTRPQAVPDTFHVLVYGPA